MKVRTKENGSNNDDWKTPSYLLDKIKEEFGEFYDPCPYQAKFDGLKSEWGDVNFINPPYSTGNKTAFIKKAIEEYKKGKTCILLIPASTETKDFKMLWENANEIRFIHKRVKFHGYNTKKKWVTNATGQTGSMLIILREHNYLKPITSLIIY